MMDSRTQYEQWHLKEFGYAAVKIEAQQITKYFQDPVWMAWLEQNKRIAKLEAKLKVASEALGFYVKYSDVNVASEAERVRDGATFITFNRRLRYANRLDGKRKNKANMGGFLSCNSLFIAIFIGHKLANGNFCYLVFSFNNR